MYDNCSMFKNLLKYIFPIFFLYWYELLKFTQNALLEVFFSKLSENRWTIQGTDASFCSSMAQALNRCSKLQ